MRNLTIVITVIMLTLSSCSNTNGNSNSTKQVEIKSEPCSKYLGHWKCSNENLEITIRSNGNNFISHIEGFNTTGDWSSKCENDELLIAGPKGNWTVGYDLSTNTLLLFGQKLQKVQN